MITTNTTWEVRQLNPGDDTQYESFLNETSEKNSSVLGYHYPFYRTIMESCGIGTPFYSGLFIDSKLVAVMPGFIRTTDTGSVYSSMPFFGPNAGVICADDSVKELAHKELLSHAIASMEKLPNPLTASFYTPFLHTEFELYEKNLPGCISVEKNTQYLEIAGSEWSTKIKYDLRKAERLMVSISEEMSDEKVNALYDIYLQNCMDYHIPPKPKQFITELGGAAKEKKGVEFYFAFHENKLVAGLIVIYSKSALSYYLPCSLDSARTLQPVTVLIDHAFQKAKQRGIKYWNWESSPDPESGVYKFKKKWGSEESKYKVFVKNLCTLEKLNSIGSAQIAKQFPYFYVYPFANLQN